MSVYSTNIQSEIMIVVTHSSVSLHVKARYCSCSMCIHAKCWTGNGHVLNRIMDGKASIACSDQRWEHNSARASTVCGAITYYRITIHYSRLGKNQERAVTGTGELD